MKISSRYKPLLNDINSYGKVCQPEIISYRFSACATISHIAFVECIATMAKVKCAQMKISAKNLLLSRIKYE